MISSLIFVILTLLSSVSLAQFKCPNGGRWNNNPNGGACEFQCYDTDTYFAQGAVTFNEIEDDCYEVRYASLFKESCSSKQDLEWPDYCGCPKCKCDSTNTGKSEIHSLQRLVNRRCYNMTCSSDSSYSSSVWELDSIGDVYDAYNWNDFQCPPIAYCEDTISGTQKYAPGDGWFANQDPLNPGTCHEYCYCSLNDAKTGVDKECKTLTQLSSLDASNPIVQSFHNQCEWELQACLDSSVPKTTMNAATSSYCGTWRCPSCDCGSHSEGDFWFVEYVSIEDNYVDAKHCARCTCENGVANCDDSFPFKVSDGGKCPGPQQLSCHMDDDNYEDSNTNGLITTGSLNAQTCSTNGPEQWCSIELDIDNSGNNDWYDWDCDEIFCGIYGENNKCWYSDFSMNYKDCYGNTRTESDKQFHYCCNSANCNHKNITMNTQTCDKSDDFSDLLSELFDCVYEEQSDCEDKIDNTEELTCENVRDLFQTEADCYCKAYRSLYNAAKNTEWQDWIEDQINLFMSRFSQWNGVITCPVPIHITCNLKSGDIILVDANGDPYTPSNAYQNKQYFVLSLITAVIAIANY
eukprot:196314_1